MFLKSERPPCAPDAKEHTSLQEAALTWVKGARESEGWSHNVGLFFHVYGHNSAGLRCKGSGSVQVFQRTKLYSLNY